MKQKSTQKIVLLALFIAIQVALWGIPNLGFVNVLAIEITTLHLPVIIASCVLGYKEGMIVGAVFGLLSLIQATNTPLPHAAFFSPFAVGGNIFSLIIVFVPRIILGFIPGFLLAKFKKPTVFHACAVSVLASITHSFLVLGMIALFFTNLFAKISNVNNDAVFKLILTALSVNGVAEAILAGICGLVVYRLRKFKGV